MSCHGSPAGGSTSSAQHQSQCLSGEDEEEIEEPQHRVAEECSGRMPFNFCTQCGTKLQPTFRFCPSCGEKLPCPGADPVPVSLTASPALTPSGKDEAASALEKSPARATKRKSQAVVTPTPVATTRPLLRMTRKSLCPESDVKSNTEDVSSPGEPSVNPVKDGFIIGNGDGLVETPLAGLPALKSSSPAVKSPRSVRGKAKLSSPANKPTESTVDGTAVSVSSPVSSLLSSSPLKPASKSRAKRAKQVSSVEPLQDGEEVTDTTGKKWKLVKVLSQAVTELIYEVCPAAAQSRHKESNHILKLGAKDGRIFNEQNFLQRAAKPASVDKWTKQNKMDFLGIPSCVGFGLHADSYRFLIFPNMGQSLQSIMEKENETLAEKTVLQLACRILDVLQYIHSNEYVHADINAENIYVKPGDKSQVYLVEYCHAFRYSPAGKHVEYREASKTPHEGTIEFISLDAHKGAAPSRRSDLQSLGYCMLRWHTGQLPWTGLAQPDQVAAQKQRFMEDVPALLSHCFGPKCVSNAFKAYLTTVMALQYLEQPDYSALKAGLSAALLQLGGTPEQPLTF